MTRQRNIGNTPLVELEGIFVKLECSNPGGSIKDRIARFMLIEAERRGELRPGDTVVETTSGNTGIALALAARDLGYRAIIYMPEHMSIERRQMIERLGGEVRLTPRDEGFEGAIERRDRHRTEPGFYVPDQFGNPDNTICHRVTTGAELIAQLAKRDCLKLDYFVAGVGTGGTLMGVGQALRAAFPGVRIVAVEPAESDVMSGGPPGEHGIMGIGDGFIPDLVDMAAVDEVLRVTSDDAHEAAGYLRTRYGYCVGRSSGANTVAALRLRDRRATVATVWPDCADRYVSLGLEPPSSKDVQCPLRVTCTERSREMLGLGQKDVPATGRGGCRPHGPERPLA